ncbi:unnamed protein product [Hymenolepis diminuta]|uniref:Uncharacterized protein n=1 Tax=Hymenolepis diminuta TaxID=6216 RepID=A0A564YHY5_HYMDI|nr:unnamed protein product [Hymenolepis diminuta]
MFFRGLTQVTHETALGFPLKRTHVCQLSAPTLPSHLCASALTRFKLRCGFREYILA